MRLLIAEDELDLAEALTVFFEKNQFSVDTVHDGFAAYDYASTGEYDAIVLDVMMPKMDGVQVLQRLVKQLSEKEGVTEALKSENQMLWVQRMNNIRSAAMESVANDLIYC